MSNIILLEDFDFDNKYEICEESVDGEKKLFYRGVLARANFANRNKRVYPLQIMEDAVGRAQESVKQRGFVGELDHPCLGVSDFSVLAKDGWVEFLSLKVGDEVATFDENNNIVYQAIETIINEPHKGKIYNLKGRNIDVPLTGTHRLYLEDRYGKREVATVKEIFDNRAKYNKHKIIKIGNWSADTPETFTIKGVEGNGRFNVDVAQDLVVDTMAFMGFMGIWLSEGCVSNEKYFVSISQNEGEKADKIRDLLKKLPFEVKEYYRKRENSVNVVFSITDKRLHSYLKLLGNCYNKFIPSELKQFDAPYLEELVDWFIVGDGRDLRHYEIGNRRNLFSVSKKLIEDLHELVIKIGGSGNWTEYTDEEDYEFAGHTIKAENKSTLYQLNLSTTKGIYLDERFLEITEEDFDANVYCLTVPNGNFYMKYKGKSYLTGNSTPKVNVDKISHVITEMKMVNGNVLGTIEPLDTDSGRNLKAMMKARIKLGVSTRGTGTVRPYSGSLGEGLVEVNPDFNLVAVDVVYSPSNDAWPDIVSESTSHVYLGGTKAFRDVWDQIFG